MPSLTTIYRTVVMIAVVAIGVKVWQLYGPSNEQVKAAIAKGVDVAQAAWNKQRNSGSDSGLAASPVVGEPGLPGTQALPAPSNPALPPAQMRPQTAQVGATLNPSPTSQMPSTPQLITAPSSPAVSPVSATASTEDRVTALISRLEKLGASDTKLSPWGTRGNLYRFCCRATAADSPALPQHFESVAAEPAVAVEQVLAKVEAWRTARQSDTMLR